MLDKITQALVSAYKRDHEGITDNVVVDFNEEKAEVKMYVKKDVVETVDNPYTEMSLEEAQAKLPQAQLGDVLRIEVKTRAFGRIAAQTARQVIVQGMREAEQGMIYDEFSAKEREILTGIVIRLDPRNGSASVRIASGGEFTDAYLAPTEQVPGEVLKEGDRLKVYVSEVRRATRGPQVMISRTHPGLVKRLFELEVPEIYDGTVEIRSTAREAAAAPRLPCGPPTPTWTPSAPVWHPRTAGEHHCGGAEGGEDRHHQVFRRPCGLCLRRPGSRLGDKRHPAGRRKELPGHRPRRPALPGYRPGGTERPSGRQAHRL